MASRPAKPNGKIRSLTVRPIQSADLAFEMPGMISFQDFDKANRLIQMLNSLGVVTVCDIDDYWMPGKEHPIHDIIRVNKINEKIDLFYLIIFS